MIRGQESIQRADDKSFLIDFETEIKEIYEDGKITGPIHLSGGNEDELMQADGGELVMLQRELQEQLENDGERISTVAPLDSMPSQIESFSLYSRNATQEPIHQIIFNELNHNLTQINRTAQEAPSEFQPSYESISNVSTPSSNSNFMSESMSSIANRAP